MSNTCKQDKDLELLLYADNDMLGVLVNCLTTDKDGKTRYTAGTLTGDKQFQAAKGDYQQVWQKIAGELQHFGGEYSAKLPVLTLLSGFGGTFLPPKQWSLIVQNNKPSPIYSQLLTGKCRVLVDTVA
ncbi:TPA: DUF3944 domain-containing protein [Morganella morganii subsp. morganii]|nr:DUF3944 domain-containing protein [Morganella morganii subsp. morganii]